MIDIATKEKIFSEIIENDRYILEVEETLQNSKEFILEAVKRNCNTYRYIKDKFKADREIALQAINTKNFCFCKYTMLYYASKEMKNDKEIALQAIKNRPEALKIVSKELRADKEVVLTAVKKDGLTLQYADITLQNDKEIVKAALKNNGMALEFAHNDLKANPEIVLEAVKQNGESIRLISKELFYKLAKHKNLVIEALKNTIHTYQYLPDDIQNDAEILKYIDFSFLKGTSAEDKNKAVNYYWNMKDPKNGHKYEIPMLLRSDPAYFFKYIDYMKLKISSPATFEKIINWD